MPKLLKRVLFVAPLLLVLYGLLGFLVLPKMALHWVNRQLAERLAEPATIEQLTLNPFTLTLTARQVRLGMAGQERGQLALLQADLEWDSLWRRTLHLASLELAEPRLRLGFDQSGTLDLSRLLVAKTEPAPAPSNGQEQRLPFSIDRLTLRAGQVEFTDRRPAQPIALAFDRIDLTVSHLSTQDSVPAAFQLAAQGPQESRLDGQGELDPVHLNATGRLHIEHLPLSALWPYAQRQVPLVLKGGRLNLDTHYRVSMTGGLSLALDRTAAKLTSLALNTSQGQPLLQLGELNLQGASIDLAQRRLDIERLDSHDLETWLARTADGHLDWQTLLPPRAPEAEAEATPPAWQIRLGEITLRQHTLHLTDQMPTEPTQLAIGPLDLTMRGFDSRGEQPFDIDLHAAVGRHGQLNAQGQLNPLTWKGTLQLALHDIDLRLAQAYMQAYLHIELRSGRLSGDLMLDLQGISPLALRLTGKTAIDQLHTLDTLGNRDFIKWQRLALQGIDYRHGEGLAIDDILLTQPYARFVINPDLSTNLNDLLVKHASGDNVGGQSADTASTSALPVRIGAIRLAEGTVSFADFSLQPHFAATIEALGGRIDRLDNSTQDPVRLKIQGKVDRYAPVSIEGHLMPFDPLRNLDITALFRQVELTTLTPYSSKFAGYRIRRGRLDLDLRYRIEQGRLSAENQVVIEQLQLGEPVESPDAIDLPIRLAVALLQDSSGTISLQLPVQGDLKNPSFDVMPVIWQALRNLLVRAAKSPFNLLSGLTEDTPHALDRIGFAAGSQALDDQARRTLDALAGALRERPGLRLEIEGQSMPARDGPLLAAQRLEQEYRKAWYRTLQERGDPVPSSPEVLDLSRLDHNERVMLLEEIYRSRLRRPVPPEWTQAPAEARIEHMRQALLDRWATNRAMLRRLSQARAAAIKDYLVDQAKLEDRRIYLLDTRLAERAESDSVMTLLHLESL